MWLLAVATTLNTVAGLHLSLSKEPLSNFRFVGPFSRFLNSFHDQGGPAGGRFNGDLSHSQMPTLDLDMPDFGQPSLSELMQLAALDMTIDSSPTMLAQKPLNLNGFGQQISTALVHIPDNGAPPPTTSVGHHYQESHPPQFGRGENPQVTALAPEPGGYEPSEEQPHIAEVADVAHQFEIAQEQQQQRRQRQQHHQYQQHDQGRNPIPIENHHYKEFIDKRRPYWRVRPEPWQPPGELTDFRSKLPSHSRYKSTGGWYGSVSEASLEIEPKSWHQKTPKVKFYRKWKASSNKPKNYHNEEVKVVYVESHHGQHKHTTVTDDGSGATHRGGGKDRVGVVDERNIVYRKPPQEDGVFPKKRLWKKWD